MNLENIENNRTNFEFNKDIIEYLQNEEFGLINTLR